MEENEDFSRVTEALEETNEGISEIIEIVSGLDSSSKPQNLCDEGTTYNCLIKDDVR